MNKTQTYAAVTEDLKAIYEEHKVSKKAQEAIDTMLALYIKPKVATRTSENPSKLDDKGLIIEAYCKYYKRYFPADECNISFRGVEGKEKYRGESLMGVKRYKEITKEIEELKSEAQKLIIAGNVKEAQEAAKKAQELFDNRVNRELYNYEDDLKRFNAVKDDEKA